MQRLRCAKNFRLIFCFMLRDHTHTHYPRTAGTNTLPLGFTDSLCARRNLARYAAQLLSVASLPLAPNADGQGRVHRAKGSIGWVGGHTSSKPPTTSGCRRSEAGMEARPRAWRPGRDTIFEPPSHASDSPTTRVYIQSLSSVCICKTTSVVCLFAGYMYTKPILCLHFVFLLHIYFQ